MPKNHPIYDDDFRQNAVHLLLTSGRPLKQVSRDLGVCPNTLRDWRNRSLQSGTSGKPALAPERDAGLDPAAEIRRLHKEVEYLRRQRDILKKAMSILSEDPQLGMR